NKDILHLDLSKVSDVSSVAIMDVSGKVLLEIGDITTTEITFDLSKFANGLYLLKLTDASGASNVQVVKH
ncbi:MAG: T9SS type A sorting domain-containing protein, partial [Fluviicola sp.]|nr:T9SS type A sorting domain-containing protein [Fluviicola sp.]